MSSREPRRGAPWNRAAWCRKPATGCGPCPAPARPAHPAPESAASSSPRSAGWLAFCRLIQLTDDHGVREMLRFLIARDTMHQNQFLAAIEELEADGMERTPVPSAFPKEMELEKVAYQFWNLTDGTAASEGRWAKGKSPDGEGKLEFVKHPEPLGDEAELGRSNPRALGTEPRPAKLAQKMVTGR